MFMLNQAGRFACSEEAGISAVGSVAAARVTQVGQVSSEEPGSVLQREGWESPSGVLSTSLEEHTPKSNPGSPVWGLYMGLTKTFCKKMRIPKGKP